LASADGYMVKVMRILLVTDCVPYPPITGSAVRVYNLISTQPTSRRIALPIPLGQPR
jgi:hypothetical protein